VRERVSALVPASLAPASFFFQAEDGIRDWSVTGVQTCALPISPLAPGTCTFDGGSSGVFTLTRDSNLNDELAGAPALQSVGDMRSEERRVGKECRSRWWAFQ